MKKLFVFFLTSVCFQFAVAQSQQENFESALMEKKGGAIVVYSSNEHSFTFNLDFGKVQPQNKPGLVIVDNDVLQFVKIPYAYKSKIIDTAVERASLKEYMNYELKYLKDDVKLEYSNVVTEWITINGKVFLSWMYNMPANFADRKDGTQKQIFLTGIFFSNFVSVNTPVLKDGDVKKSQTLLLKVASTFKENDFKIDFNELYKELHKQ
jgi:hypothetical protein